MQGAQLESRLKWEVGNTYKKKKKPAKKKERKTPQKSTKPKGQTNAGSRLLIP